MQDFSNQFIKFLLTHLVAEGTLDSIPVLNLDKWSCSDSFMNVIAYHIASSPKFLGSIMVREFDRAAEVAGSDGLDSPSLTAISRPPQVDVTTPQYNFGL